MAIVVNYWHYTCSLLCLSSDANVRVEGDAGSSHGIKIHFSDKLFFSLALSRSTSCQGMDGVTVQMYLSVNSKAFCPTMGPLLNGGAMCLVLWRLKQDGY